MKTWIFVAALAFSSTAFANIEIEKTGPVAAAAVKAIISAGVESSDESEDGGLYHVWNLTCQFKVVDWTIVTPSCYLAAAPSGKAPEYLAVGEKAADLVHSLLTAGVTCRHDDESSTLKINLLNVDGFTSVHGPESYRLKFVDKNR